MVDRNFGWDDVDNPHTLGGAEEEGFTIDDLKGRVTDHNEFKEQELGPEWLRECGQIWMRWFWQYGKMGSEEEYRLPHHHHHWHRGATALFNVSQTLQWEKSKIRRLNKSGNEVGETQSKWVVYNSASGGEVLTVISVGVKLTWSIMCVIAWTHVFVLDLKTLECLCLCSEALNTDNTLYTESCNAQGANARLPTVE